MLLFPNGVGACDILNVLNYVSYSNISNPGWHHVWWTSMSRAQYPEQLPARYITFHWCSRTLSFLRPYVSLFKLLILVTNFDWNKCEMSINNYELFFHCAVQRRQMPRQILNSALIALTVSLRDGWPYHNRYILVFNPKIYIADFGPLYRALKRGFWNKICNRSFQKCRAATKKKVYPLFQILGFTSSTKDDPIDLKFWLHF